MKTQKDLADELENTHRRTMQLFEDLDDSQLAVPYERGINPPIWELGHAAFFYEYFLLRKYQNPNPIMPGYDEIWDSFEIHHRARWKKGIVPPKQEAFDYYHKILDAVNTIIDKPEISPDAFYLTQYCIYHQNMHIESLIWARQTLGYPVPQSYVEPHPENETLPKRDIEIPGGNYFIGIPDDSEVFSFDNERPGFEKQINRFQIASQLVSNGEFLEFVEDEAGYKNTENWSFGGQQWVDDQPEKKAQPMYWSAKDGEWFIKFFDREIPLLPQRPALHLNYWEAEAFCHWSGRRLPTEFEWEAAARGDKNYLYPRGNTMNPDRVDMDAISLGHHSTSAMPEGQTDEGCSQMLGTAWEWTSSQYLPFDGFTMDMYPYMSTLQFGDHKTTRGGSCATSSCLIRNTYRQAYHPGRFDAFTGFRTVKDQ